MTTTTTMTSFCTKINRTKKIDPERMMATPLNRCLNTFDITLLGVGHMVGSGIYVLTGEVAKNVAGPAVILSYIISGIAAFLTAVCYAEFGARVPRAGSAYVYTYVTIGEMWAFLVGWNILLEHVIGAASVARAWSGYVDSFFDGAIQNATLHYVGHINVDFFGQYPDFLAFFIFLVLGALLTTQVKGSSYINMVLTTVNMGVIIFIICCGLYWANVKNWTEVPGGFLPFGLRGVVTGAGLCFYAFVGFDVIATSGEEARNPQSSIPIATFIAMAIVSLAYVLISVTLTLMAPYNTILPTSALPSAFAANGATWAKYMVATGALCGITCTLFGLLFSVPRCLYSMAADGLFFEIFSKIHPKVQVPIVNIIVCSLCAALVALLFDFKNLVELLSIGTLTAYTFVDVSVIILRYQPTTKFVTYAGSESCENIDGIITKNGSSAGKIKSSFQFLQPVFDYDPGFVARVCVIQMTTFLAAFCCVLRLASQELVQMVWWAVFLVIFFLGGALVCLVIICMYEQNKEPMAFKVPCVPLFPALSIFLNLALMVNLNQMTWIRFAVWILVGLLVYFGYGIRHSKENESSTMYCALLAAPSSKSKSSSADEKEGL